MRGFSNHQPKKPTTIPLDIVLQPKKGTVARVSHGLYGPGGLSVAFTKTPEPFRTVSC